MQILDDGRKAYPQDAELRAMLAHSYMQISDWRRSLSEAREVTRLAPGTDFERAVWLQYVASKIPHGLLTEEEKKRIHALLETNKDVLKIKVTDDAGKFDPTEILAFMKERSQASDEIIGLYEKQHLPGSVIASALGFTVWEFWWQITHDIRHNWWLAAGDRDEQDRELSLAGKSSGVVLDYSALCTLSALGQLGMVSYLFEKVLITAETRRVFTDEMQRLDAMPASIGKAAYHEGRLVFFEADPSQHEQKRRWLSDVIEFLNCPSVTCVGPSAEIWAKFHKRLFGEDDQRVLFDGGVGVSILTAITFGFPLFSDEAVLRTLVRNEFGVEGFCTQAIIRLAAQRRYNTDIFLFTEKLLELNYHFVSVPENFIVQHLAKYQYRKTRVAERLFRELVTTTLPHFPGVFELGKAAGALWFNPGAWNRDDWISNIRGQLNRLVPSTDLLWFSMGIAVELRHFPFVAVGLRDRFLTDPLLSAEAKKLLSVGFSTAIKTFRDNIKFGPRINKVWGNLKWTYPGEK
jgi:hypothetical protein